MNDQSRCLVRAATGPIILITVGTLFALEKFTPYRFGQTWPVLLIVIGLLRMLGGGNPKLKKYRQMTGGPWAGRNPFPPFPQQQPQQPQWKPAPNAPPPAAPPPPPPYSTTSEPMPDMTPPPPARPGERR